MLKFEGLSPFSCQTGSIRHVRHEPGSRWALAHAVSGWYAHLSIVGACSPLAVARLRRPEDLSRPRRSCWTPRRWDASHTSSAFFSHLRTTTCTRPHMWAVCKGRSASLRQSSTSSGRRPKQNHEFRNLNNGVNRAASGNHAGLLPGRRAAERCVGGGSPRDALTARRAGWSAAVSTRCTHLSPRLACPRWESLFLSVSHSSAPVRARESCGSWFYLRPVAGVCQPVARVRVVSQCRFRAQRRGL